MEKRRHKRYKPRERKARDVWLVILSVAAALYLAQSGVVTELLAATNASDYLASFIAGMFFTTLFTVAPAGVALVELANDAHPLLVALFGAAGAVVGDLILLAVVHGTIGADIKLFVRASFVERVAHILRSRYLHWTLPLIGGFLIASPLPDELGLTLLGLSSARIPVVVVVSYAANFVGIMLIVSAVLAVST